MPVMFAELFGKAAMVFMVGTSLWFCGFFSLKIRTRRFLRASGVSARGRAGKVRYGTEGGAATRIDFTGPDGSNYGFWTGGALEGEVDIVYDPDKPERAEAVRNLWSTWREWTGVVFFGAASVGFIALAVRVLFE